jgi:epoxyqueuosine reductase QueG
MTDVSALLKKAGFAEGFLLPVAPYTNWTRHRNDGVFHPNTTPLVDDPQTAYPWANAILICVMPYTPYDDETLVASYYPASNRAYHAMRRLLTMLKEEGIRAERAETPYREQLAAYGIGSQMDNQLLFLEPYGTYFNLQGAMLALPEPVRYEPRREPVEVCDHCGACKAVCFGAIKGEHAFDWTRCVHTYLEGDPIPQDAMEWMPSLLGCMRCQAACPKNPQSAVPIPEEIRRTLDPVRILAGNRKEAGELIGKNLAGPNRLLRQAIVIAANRNRVDALPYLERLRETDGERFCAELDYAISLLQNQQDAVIMEKH